jgi:hypothetical protein
MPVLPIEYLSVTFNRDMTFGPSLVLKGTTMSLQKDFARGIGPGVSINGPGSSADAIVLGAGGGGGGITNVIDGGAPSNVTSSTTYDGGTP